MLTAFPLMKKKKKMKQPTEEAKYRYHNFHHEEMSHPLTYKNLSAHVLESVRQYFWMDMCLFGY
jgi:hypothetical protein